MEEVIGQEEWKNHAFLSKLKIRSDYDGDAAFTISDPTEDDYKESLSVRLEYRINGGDWIAASFASSTAFIDESSMAWYFNFSYHPWMAFDRDQPEKDVHEWRAVITGESVDEPN